MAVSTQQYQRLLNYLDGRLAPEEEERFVEELESDVALQKEFDFEVLLRGRQIAESDTLNPAAETEFEPAETHLQKVKAALENRPEAQAAEGEEKEKAEEPKEEAKVVRLKTNYKKIISIAALFILVATFWVLYLKRQKPESMAGTKPTPKTNEVVVKPKDSLPVKPSLSPEIVNPEPAIASVPAAELFRENYKPYESTDEDPPVLRDYHTAYLGGDYAEVLNAAESAYEVKGANDSLPPLYLRFYKALSLLERGKTATAIGQFKTLLPQTGASLQLRGAVQWYLAMAYLKSNNTAAAKKTLQKLTEEKARLPYKPRASMLLNSLKTAPQQ